MFHINDRYTLWRERLSGLMKPRPAFTYRANKHWLNAKLTPEQIRELPRRLDRKTERGLSRSRRRFQIGRWPGVGDARATISYRKQTAAEATAQKPKRKRKTPAVAAVTAAMALGA